MAEQGKCPLCGKECTRHRDIGRSKAVVECRVCGEYEITEKGLHYIENIEKPLPLYILSGVTRMTCKDSGQRFLITEEIITKDDVFDAEIRNRAPRGVVGKCDLLLRYLVKESEKPSDIVVIEPLWDYPIAFCKDRDELDLYINQLVDSGLVKHVQSTARSYGLKITFKGWEKIEQMARPNLESKQAFVAMWFDDEVKEAFNKGMLKLEEDTGFSMFRVDMKQFNDKICDRIITEIKNSRFLIADFTGQRQGVYFEAGYAMGMGLTVIYTCREDEADRCHFDTRQYNHVVWKTPEDLRDKLRDRILATIGKV